ncbi:MAG: hypothetical protein B7Z73_13985 [Planctomycetia bacterium 21-64-5]|nr:MAG: hypothetical protein B7Z73_13985 [Planctomycetia bacterium 21-64-5]
MDRYRGHLYNWYDTRSLQPLRPHYISTVDSGNFAGHVLVLRSGLLELAESNNLLPSRAVVGLRDTLRVLLDVARGLERPGNDRGVPLVPADVLRKIERIEQQLEARPNTVSATVTLLSRLVVDAGQVKAAAHANNEFLWWASAFERSCIEHRDELLCLAPWADLPPPPDEVRRQRSPGHLQAIHELDVLLSRLQGSPSLREVAGMQSSLLPTLDGIMTSLAVPSNGQTGDAAQATCWFRQLRQSIFDASQRAADRIQGLQRAANRCQELADMDFSFLFDKSRDLFAIGYNVDERRLDGSFYDLLASEARLASYVTIAQGQIDQEHWFALGRLLTTTGGAATLLSWSGSMFEYLMPLLVMPTYANTLLDRTCQAVVRRQIDYGRQRGVPWGISESGYNTVDLHMNYQYRAFGVPGLGLKRGLAEDLVIAPYASALALMVSPEAACGNLERLAAEGFCGAYGLYEAVDFTPSRMPRGTPRVAIRQFMAHHQGMSLLSLAYLLLDRPMQRRFASDPMLQAADLLLQERVPKASAMVFPHVAEASATRSVSAEEQGTMRVLTDPGGAAPEVNLLSNGRYHVVITSAGGGYSRWRDLAVTRWREDER